MFSFQNEYVPIEDSDYHDPLAFRLGKLSKDKLDDVLLWLSESNLDVQFQLVAKIVPMYMDDTFALLEDDRHYEKEWEELIAQFRARVQNYVRS